MLRRIYDWTMGLAGHRHALGALGVVSFIESSIFPVPPDVMIIPMVLANRARAWLIAGVATVTSVLGGLAGYAIGALLFESVGKPLLAFYGYGEKFARFQDQYNEWGAWIVAGAGITPFPFKVITIASGVTGLDLVVFTVAALLSRGARFYIEAGLLWKFGPPIRDFIENNLALLTMIFFAALLGGFVAIKFLI